MKTVALKLALLVFLTAWGFSSVADAKSDAIRVAVYTGPASCEDCSETAKTAIENLGARYHVDLIGVKEITPENLSRYDVYVQPGGGQDIPAALASFGDERVEAIQEYVAGGGRYLGLCMGAYLASGSGIGLIPHELDSEVGRPGFPVDTIESTAVTTQWNGHRTSIFYQDGPYMLRSPNDPGFKSIATYENGDIAAARYSFKKGVVVLSGPHPEAGKDWFEEADVPLSKMPGLGPLNSLFAQLNR